MIHIVLFQPEIPSNTGNIIRTIASGGAKLHIIKPMGFSFEEKELKRAGMDYIDFSDITFYESLDDFLLEYEGETIYAISRYGKRIYSSFDYHDLTKDIFFLFGKESSGLPHEYLKNNQDTTLRIPMRPEARSLNLSNCVALVLYEALRQQNFEGLATYEAIKGRNFLDEE